MLTRCFALHAVSTLLHHVHNAVYLGDYPGMPAWLTPWLVLAVWTGVSGVGASGYWLVRHGYRYVGLILLGAYGLYGMDSLMHYTRGPVAAHTAFMNMTIWLEAATGALLLAAAAAEALKYVRQGARP